MHVGTSSAVLDPEVVTPPSAGAGRTGAAADASAKRPAPPPVQESAPEAAARGAEEGKRSKLKTMSVIGACVLGGIAVIALARKAYTWLRGRAGGAMGGLGSLMGRGAAALPYADAKTAKKGAEAFAAFVKQPDIAPLVGALGPKFGPQLLWVFSGVAPQVYIPAAGIGTNGQAREGVDPAKLALLQAALERSGFVVRQDGADGISVFNVEASQKVANANPDIFPDVARADMRKWLASPEVVLHAGADHANAHQIHLWYGLLSGFPPEATKIHCARERVMAKIRGSALPFEQKAAVVTSLNEINAIENEPKPLTSDKVGRLTKAAAALQTLVANVLTGEEQQLLQMVSRELPHPSPVSFNAYTAGDAKWGAAVAQLAKGVVELPEIKALLPAAA